MSSSYLELGVELNEHTCMASSLVREDWSDAEVTDGVALIFSGVIVDDGRIDVVLRCSVSKNDCNVWICRMKIVRWKRVDVMMDVGMM